MAAAKTSVLFVCTGNICRSPTAEAVLRKRARDAGLAHRLEVDSVGTIGYHQGSPPDRRTRQAAARRGYDLDGLRARQIERWDYEHHDLILAMGPDHVSYMLAECPDRYADKIRLLLEFAGGVAGREVPDPYYGGSDGFDLVLDLVEDACDGVLRHLQEQWSKP